MTHLPLILLMALVTYLPRLLPAVAIGRFRFRGKAERFLSLIPYTAMTALVFPGVLSVDGDNMVVGLVGAAVAMLLSWKKLPLLVVMLGAIGAVMLCYAILP